jgi:hypothetical protein
MSSVVGSSASFDPGTRVVLLPMRGWEASIPGRVVASLPVFGSGDRRVLVRWDNGRTTLVRVSQLGEPC